MTAESPKKRLDGFLAEYAPEVAKLARAALIRMRRNLPGARLSDPWGFLEGSGKQVRRIVLESAAELEKPAARAARRRRTI